MSKFSGSIFDSETPSVVKVSRVGSAAILSTCAMLLYMILTI